MKSSLVHVRILTHYFEVIHQEATLKNKMAEPA